MDTVEDFAEHIRRAAREGAPLRPRGGGSKDFYGNPPAGAILDTRSHAGIVEYAPEELVLTARCGTPLADIEQALAERGQMLAFEPPHFGAATLGGCVAAGLSGPRRPYAGAARDFVLGVTMLDGRGQRLAFGGRVMKNVAGYDVSRLMVGAMGCLGLLLEISLKVLPRPETDMTLRFEMGEAEAVATMNRWAGQPLPLSAAGWRAGVLSIRLSGVEPALRAARARLGGEAVAEGGESWRRLREQEPVFFQARPLWRLSLPATAPAVELPGETWIEWGGAQRWLAGDLPAERVYAAAGRLGGHATLFRADAKGLGVLQPLSPPLLAIHRRLKAVFDPAGVFNPGRLYPEL